MFFIFKKQINLLFLQGVNRGKPIQSNDIGVLLQVIRKPA